MSGLYVDISVQSAFCYGDDVIDLKILIGYELLTDAAHAAVHLINNTGINGLYEDL